MSLPMDTIDVELTIRMVKGIYTYRKDHMAESMVFSPWSRTMIPFPLLQRKIQASKMRVDKQQHGTITMQCPSSLPLLSQSIIHENVLQVRPGSGGLTKSIGLIL